MVLFEIVEQKFVVAAIFRKDKGPVSVYPGIDFLLHVTQLVLRFYFCRRFLWQNLSEIYTPERMFATGSQFERRRPRLYKNCPTVFVSSFKSDNSLKCSSAQ